VVERLRAANYEGYVVGGAVRDLILGAKPKDFDVATNATPEEIKSLFRSARIIGRRFQIVHVRDGREIIEVTTYRGPHQSESSVKSASKQSDKGLLLRDNVYGSLAEDAARRDLTINAMYYDPIDESVLDEMGGNQDIEARLVRILGDPQTRYREDPVRMLRVIRFAARLQFDIESETEAAIGVCGPLLGEIPPARLFDEFLKLFMAGHGRPTLLLLLRYQLLDSLCPDAALLIEKEPRFKQLVTQAMGNTDQRVKDGRHVTPAFLLAALLWPVVQTRANAMVRTGEAISQAIHSAGQQVIAETCQKMSIPKRFSYPVREIWELQPRLERRQSKRVKDLIADRRFRAAYDLLLLREESSESLDNAGKFWEQQQLEYPTLVGTAPPRTEDKPPRRRRPRRKKEG
jgi:poly(A) polymerase